MPKRRKRTDDEIVAILQEHHGGLTAKEVIRRHGISLDTFYRWKRQYSGMTRPSCSGSRRRRTKTGASSAWWPTRRSTSRC
jgi:putative transposase